VPAAAAFAGGVVFKEFNLMIALGAFNVKNCPFLPVLGILPGTFHDFILSLFDRGGSQPLKSLIMSAILADAIR
jgi:hypothetical protein